MESVSLVELEPRFPRTPMMYPLSCRVAEVVQKVLERYEKATKTKINRNKCSGLWLGAWKSVDLPGSFSWTDSPVCVLGVWFGPGLRLKKNWSELLAKIGAAPKAIVLKGVLPVHLSPHPLPVGSTTFLRER